MNSPFCQWLIELSEIAAKENVIVEAKYYDGLDYFYNTLKLKPLEAYPKYLDLSKRIVAINEEYARSKQIVDWEMMEQTGSGSLFRTKVPSGWLVKLTEWEDPKNQCGNINPLFKNGYTLYPSLCFVPDSNHEWNKPEVVLTNNDYKGGYERWVKDLTIFISKSLSDFIPSHNILKRDYFHKGISPCDAAFDIVRKSKEFTHL